MIQCRLDDIGTPEHHRSHELVLPYVISVSKQNLVQVAFSLWESRDLEVYRARQQALCD